MPNFAFFNSLMQKHDVHDRQGTNLEVIRVCPTIYEYSYKSYISFVWRRQFFSVTKILSFPSRVQGRLWAVVFAPVAE